MKYAIMRKAGVPVGCCLQRAQLDGQVSPEELNSFANWCSQHRVDEIKISDIVNAFEATEEFVRRPAPPNYVAMIKVGVPYENCVQRLQLHGAAPEELQSFAIWYASDYL